MRNIVEALNRVPDGRVPKTGFDLSNFENFTQKGGMLNVVGVRDTMPNSDYRMAVDGFTRSLPCNTANFAHIKENYYFVHVPLALVSRNAYQTLVQRKQAYSAVDMGIAQFPVFSLATVVNRCLEIAHLNLTLSDNQKFKDVHGFNIGRQAFRLFDMLGYGCYTDILESTFKESGGLTVEEAKSLVSTYLGTYKPTANRLAAYQCVWYHFFRNDIYDCDVSAKSFNFDDVTYMSGSEPSYDILDYRTVDDFIINCCQIRYVGYKKDIFMGSMPGTQFGAVSSIGIDVSFSDLTASFVGNTVNPVFRGNVTEAQFETSSDEGKHVVRNGQTGQPVTAAEWSEYLNPSGGGRFYPIKELNELAGGSESVFRSPLIADASHMVNLLSEPAPGNPSPIDTHIHSGSVPIQSSGTIDPFTPSGSVVLSGTPTSTSLFDVLQLVEAQAIQKWRQKSMLAGNKTADQFRAHHGEVPRHLVDHLPDFIGSVDNEIQITEITSQADTASSPDESNLGEIVGRGYGASDNKVFHFHSDDYGILFLLHAIVPENTYSSYGFDFGNTMVYYNDFFQTEYQNIGLQAVPKYLLNTVDLLGTPLYGGNHGAEGDEHFSENVGVVGYAPRYFNYKQYPSKVHGLFNPSRLTVYGSGAPSRFGYSDMQSFVMPRADLVLGLNNSSVFPALGLVLQLTNIYVNPSIFDSIFAVNADSSEVTDTFISHVKFYCEASLPMSVLGLPQF